MKKLNKSDVEFVEKHFDVLKQIFNSSSQSEDDYLISEENVYNLNHCWRSNGVLWILSFENCEGYESSAFQIGINDEGKLVIESQSHCSCYGWYNSNKDNTLEVDDFNEIVDNFSVFDFLVLEDEGLIEKRRVIDYKSEGFSNDEEKELVEKLEDEFVTQLKNIIDIYFYIPLKRNHQ